MLHRGENCWWIAIFFSVR